MMQRPAEGFVAVMSKSDLCAWGPIGAYQNIMAQWDTGAAFIRFDGIHGEVCTVKGGQVEMVVLWTPAAVASIEAAEEEERNRARIEGGQ